MNLSPLLQLGMAGQAIWLDFVSRDFLKQGGLHTLVAREGVTGVTSNPTIFEKAMGHGTDYDPGLQAFLDLQDTDVVSLYEHLAIQDIQAAADILRPVYERLAGRDGYVSLEVAPCLAYDSQASLTEARRLWTMVSRPNLMIKIPGTDAGIPVIQQLIEDGINVNVTLLFSRQAYAKVAQAYMAGLEARLRTGKSLTHVASVASFFVSRIDAKVDACIDTLISAGGDATALGTLKGRVAIANAQLAYEEYNDIIRSARWQVIAAQGAQVQRLLWASTGVKDPAYADTLYVDTLIGPDTVNTMPPKTLKAFRDHGMPDGVRATIGNHLDAARQTIDSAGRLGIDLSAITDALVTDGAQQFRDAADALLSALSDKRRVFLGKRQNAMHVDLPSQLKAAVDIRLEQARQEAWSRRLWQGDASLWTGTDEAQWMGWLGAAQGSQVETTALAQFAASLAADHFTDAVLLGMGGSSLGAEVLALTLGSVRQAPRLQVLDSTDPAQIATVRNSIDIARTLFIVSSKSGATLEPDILRLYFHAALVEVVGVEQAGQHFVAVTDPQSALELAAKQEHYRAIFHGDVTIGGRYSVLSVFGMVPLAILGHDVATFYQLTQPMVHACASGAPPAMNPGVYLGVVLGEAVNAGRDKVTLIASPSLVSLGAWLEQLLAESTGKQGKGVVPVNAEPVGMPAVYDKDRLFIYVCLETDETTVLDRQVDALVAAGHPVVRISLSSSFQIGQEFVRWEIATAIAGAVIGINPFDQPDVEASKRKTHALTDDYEQTGRLTTETPLVTHGNVSVYGDVGLKADGSLAGVMRAHFKRLVPGDYAALLAYVERQPQTLGLLDAMRVSIRNATRNATVAGFGPRFLHSTGQAYKGGPDSGVFLQITASAPHDLPVPERHISFGVVEAAQAQGDLEVLRLRGRRWLRLHVSNGDVAGGLARIATAIDEAFH